METLLACSSAVSPATQSNTARFSPRKQLRVGKKSPPFRVKAVSVPDSAVENPAPEIKEAIKPVYTPTPSNRPLRTPHSGYHFDGTRRQFFEGWFFKVSIPECRQSFCYMYSVENPAFTKPLNGIEEVQYGRRFTGVGAQILGADDKYICQYTPESNNFWGERHELSLGNTFIAQTGARPPNKEVPPQVQCNVFEGADGEVSLTSGGGLRQIPGPGTSDNFENAALAILDVTSNMAGVEVGGGPWFNTWKGTTNAPEILKQALNAPVDIEGIFGLVPLFKPPGL
nr:probable tocopherol cyclase, chloroplastic [Ipomoea batatas]